MQQTLRINFTFFFFNDTATTEIYTLSLHDALPIFPSRRAGEFCACSSFSTAGCSTDRECYASCGRSEEHTSELQSRLHLVCRLLLEKKKKSSSRYDDVDIRRPLVCTPVTGTVHRPI